MINKLITQCFSNGEEASVYFTPKLEAWSDWLQPISDDSPVGEDPNYEDKFEQLKDEVNKITGADTELIAQLAESLLKDTSKDLRIVTYYIWARLQRDGETGFSEGLILLAGLLKKFDKTLLPKRDTSKITAIEWLNSNKIMDTFTLYPEINKDAFKDAAAALYVIYTHFQTWEENLIPSLSPLISFLDTRISQNGGFNPSAPLSSGGGSGGEGQSYAQSGQLGQPQGEFKIKEIQSGRELLDQAKELCKFLIKQENGWLSSSRLMRALRWDTVHQLPPADGDGKTKLMAPRQEFKQKLKRLHLGKQWLDLLEQVEVIFAQGANHFWLDLQWYACQAMQNMNSPYDNWHEIATRDMKSLLERLYGLETLSFNDGTPFADETTLQWLNQKIIEEPQVELPTQSASSDVDNSILSLESEAVALADSEGVEKAFQWLGTINHAKTDKERFLLRLIMARLAEQYGKNEMAIHIYSDLAFHSRTSDQQPNATERTVNLSHWEPDLMFEIYAKLLKLLRQKYNRDNDKTAQNKILEPLLAILVKIDPIRASILC